MGDGSHYEDFIVRIALPNHSPEQTPLARAVPLRAQRHESAMAQLCSLGQIKTNLHFKINTKETYEKTK